MIRQTNFPVLFWDSLGFFMILSGKDKFYEIRDQSTGVQNQENMRASHESES